MTWQKVQPEWQPDKRAARARHSHIGFHEWHGHGGDGTNLGGDEVGNEDASNSIDDPFATSEPDYTRQTGDQGVSARQRELEPDEING